LRQHIEKLGYKRNFVIYDESEQLGAIKKILANISAKGEKTDPSAVLQMLSKFKNGGERARFVRRSQCSRPGRACRQALRNRPARVQRRGFR
jgi:superfamily I DNA/RNA helicase